MRFLNSDAIGITIKNRQEKTQAQFKAYLEKSDVEYKIQEYVMPNSNIGEGRTHEVLKVVYNILLDFNVIAEYEEEAVENYDKLHLLLHYIKPVISSKGVHKEITLNPDFVKSNDRLYINFKGLPKILNDKIYQLKADGTIDLSSNPDLTQNDIPIQIFGFSYSINKELGYIQMPNSKEERRQGKKYSSKGVTLFPIGFKISMQCRVVADLEYLANVQYNLFEIDPVTGDRKEINLNTILPSYRNQYKNYLKSAKASMSKTAATGGGVSPGSTMPTAAVGGTTPTSATAPATKPAASTLPTENGFYVVQRILTGTKASFSDSQTRFVIDLMKANGITNIDTKYVESVRNPSFGATNKAKLEDFIFRSGEFSRTYSEWETANAAEIGTLNKQDRIRRFAESSQDASQSYQSFQASLKEAKSILR